MATTLMRWQIRGDYFENCNCEVVCPCVFSTKPVFQEKPSQGFCEVALAFHVEQGQYGEVPLDGLNAIVMARSPGTMSAGNWTAAGAIHGAHRARRCITFTTAASSSRNEITTICPKLHTRAGGTSAGSSRVPVALADS